MKNRYAQILYGKVLYIFETNLKFDQLATIFDPSTYWVDVTGMECEVGYIAEFKDGLGLVLTAPPNTELTFEEEKAAKLAALKAERDAKEVKPIEYNGHSYDYDEKARDRINAAIIALELAEEDAALEWTCADNTDATVTAADLKNIIAAVAVRSNALHVAYRAAKTAVEAAQTQEELEAIVLN